MSVYHTQDLSETDVWGLGRDYVEPTLKKTILARADLSAVEYGKRNLTLVSNPIPHERHYDVVNWPDSEWLKVAADLADAAELVLRPGEPENVP
jgi:hypothetical protein